MKRIITFCFVLASFSHIHSQQSADKALQYISENLSQENIYILTDKDLYLSGETLWFNAMVFRNFSISDLSTNFFIELYDKNKKQILRKRFPVFNGVVQGSFQIPESLTEDIYFVRAYTPMMSNLSEDFQYIKQIPIYNPSSPKKLVADKSSSWSATVHPEGNSLIAGNQSKIAVRLHNIGTAPTQWEGYVIEKDHPEKKIATFKGFDENVGVFSLIPEKDKIYEAVITDNNGLQKSIALPKASEKGVSLQVISEKDNIKYKIKNSGENIPYYTVIASIGDQLVYKAKVNQLKDSFQVIPTNQLINGVLQLTVFDDKENVLVNRMCFVMPQNQNIAAPEVKPEIISTEKRALNSLEIKPLKDIINYSVTVFDPEFKKSLQDENLLSSLWLTGVIKSKINRPAQYFTEKRNTEALDALLISEQWKSFDWKEIIAGNYPSIINNPSKYISYKARVTLNAKPAPQQTLIMFIEGGKSGSEFFQVETDSNGEFFFDNMLFEKPIKVTYQFNGANAALKSRTNVYVNPTNTFIPLKKELPAIEGYQLVDRISVSSQPAEITKIIASKKAKKEYDEKIITIEEVKLKAKKKDLKEELNNKLSSPLYRSMSETVFDFVNENQSAASSQNILQWLQGRAAGLTINYENGIPTPYIRQAKANVYLDEMLTDASALTGLSSDNIAMVKIIKDGAIGMSGGGNGGVLIYTKRGDTKPVTKTNSLSEMVNLNFFVMEGYNQSEKYPDSDYGNSELSKISSDYRPVLYWNPNTEIDSDTPAKVDFYNNDTAKKFRFLIMGFDAEKYTPVYYEKLLP
ncbi:hypothetical protein NAL32_10010 [Chryseobacterium sp. Ch-15]|uniref:TonB-dependent Receptor Plug Domain n=1 Tax=Chryseobacterium muglaense TaxID=2893752 RepID=A0A9Q3USM3_9FLAO|nr:hypothetical protein [Chryseobacterium muglaense]MBD3904798.1 hypothetical protein [Chryseobacterium muglaense]MCC9033642.1 hypothetical protein [Chryseobacterium muglaense]MCM2554717.1 hypothetical protein [Chryseobacterium muglaense]